MLELKAVSKTYRKDSREIRVLSEVDFKLESGDMVSVIGASGAGKSTLLHILGTFDQPDSGDVVFDGRVMSKVSTMRCRNFGTVRLVLFSSSTIYCQTSMLSKM